MGPCFCCLDIWSPGLPPGSPDQFYSLSNNPKPAWVLTSQPSYHFSDVWLWQGPCSLYLSSLMCIMELIIVISVWGCCRIKQVITMKVPSTVWEYKSGCFFSLSLFPAKWTLSCSRAKELQVHTPSHSMGYPLQEFVYQQGPCLPRDRILQVRRLVTRGVREGQALPAGPASVV